MKRVIFTLLAVTFCLVLWANEPADTPVKNTELTYAQAIESGKPVFLLFTTEKSCNCKNKTCKKVELKMNDYFKSLPEEIAFVRLEVVDEKVICQKHRVMSAPTLVIIDGKGEELEKLQYYEITEEVIEEAIAEHKLLKDK